MSKQTKSRVVKRFFIWIFTTLSIGVMFCGIAAFILFTHWYVVGLEDLQDIPTLFMDYFNSTKVRRGFIVAISLISIFALIPATTIPQY